MDPPPSSIERWETTLTPGIGRNPIPTPMDTEEMKSSEMVDRGDDNVDETLTVSSYNAVPLSTRSICGSDVDDVATSSTAGDIDNMEESVPVTSVPSGDDSIDGHHLVPPPSLARQLADEESADMIRTAASTCSTNEPRGLLGIDTPTQNGMFVSSWGDDNDGVADKDMDSFVERVLTAAEEGQLGVLEEMVATNPQAVHMQDADGYTALHRAAYNNHPEVAQRLLQMESDPRARTGNGWTPLHCAACWANPAVAEVLLADARVDVNARTEGDLTPLHLAVACTTSTPGATTERIHQTVHLLLKHPGIETNGESKGGDTPKSIAFRAHKNLYQLFEKA